MLYYTTEFYPRYIACLSSPVGHMLAIESLQSDEFENIKRIFQLSHVINQCIKT